MTTTDFTRAMLLPNARYVFISGPMFTSGTIGCNVNHAVHVAVRLRNTWTNTSLAGAEHIAWIPFVPHLYAALDMIAPQGDSFYGCLDYHWLAKCDALLRLPGRSVGADQECVWARKLGIPIFRSVEALLDQRHDVLPSS